MPRGAPGTLSGHAQCWQAAKQQSGSSTGAGAPWADSGRRRLEAGGSLPTHPGYPTTKVTAKPRARGPNSPQRAREGSGKGARSWHGGKTTVSVTVKTMKPTAASAASGRPLGTRPRRAERVGINQHLTRPQPIPAARGGARPGSFLPVGTAPPSAASNTARRSICLAVCSERRLRSRRIPVPQPSGSRWAAGPSGASTGRACEGAACWQLPRPSGTLLPWTALRLALHCHPPSSPCSSPPPGRCPRPDSMVLTPVLSPPAPDNSRTPTGAGALPASSPPGSTSQGGFSPR